MHPDDAQFVLENKKSNFVLGLQTSKETPVIYINFIDPGTYDFHQALRDACTIALTSQTVTQAQANIIAYVYQKLQKQKLPTSKLTVSVNEHVILSVEHAAIPILVLDQKVVEFYWHAIAYSKERVHLVNMNLQYILSNTSGHIGNIMHERLIDIADTKVPNDDDEDFMNFYFFHRKEA